MRVKDYGNSVSIWLSARDTYDWSTKPGAAWPCSTIASKRLFAAFDSTGLVDMSVNGRYTPTQEIDGNEFNAITSDFLRDRIPADHSCYFVIVGQFE